MQKIFETIAERLEVYLRTILILSGKSNLFYLRNFFLHYNVLLDQQPHINIKESSNNDSIIVLPTQNVLGYEIGKLFSCLQCPDQHEKDYHVSVPYFESYSKTMTLSIGQITNTALLSLDVKLCDFLDDITYFNGGPDVYVTLFDTKGIVWMHKDFPRIETIIEQPLKVHLQDIENISYQTMTKMINEMHGVIDVKTKLGEQVS